MNILRNKSTDELVQDLFELKLKLSELNYYILEHEYVIKEKLISEMDMNECADKNKLLHCLKLDYPKLKKYFK
tara:strand:+ start:509 stop:727 length:219 start_codon:yes stop_codon:yes gene_type:complete